jgi:hypothetical protein
VQEELAAAARRRSSTGSILSVISGIFAGLGNGDDDNSGEDNDDVEGRSGAADREVESSSTANVSSSSTINTATSGIGGRSGAVSVPASLPSTDQPLSSYYEQNFMRGPFSIAGPAPSSAMTTDELQSGTMAKRREIRIVTTGGGGGAGSSTGNKDINSTGSTTSSSSSGASSLSFDSSSRGVNAKVNVQTSKKATKKRSFLYTGGKVSEREIYLKLTSL